MQHSKDFPTAYIVGLLVLGLASPPIGVAVWLFVMYNDYKLTQERKP